MGWLYQYIVRAIPIFFLQQFYYRILCLLEFSLQLERNSILSPLVPKCMYIFLNQSSATWSVILINFVDFQSRKNSINLCRNVLEDGQIVKLLNLLECSFWDTKILYANIDPCTGIGTVGVFLSGWASYILVGGIFGSKGRGKWFPTRNFTPSIWYFFLDILCTYYTVSFYFLCYIRVYVCTKLGTECTFWWNGSKVFNGGLWEFVRNKYNIRIFFCFFLICTMPSFLSPNHGLMDFRIALKDEAKLPSTTRKFLGCPFFCLSFHYNLHFSSLSESHSSFACPSWMLYRVLRA